MNEQRAVPADELYESFLQASDEAESQGLMARLIADCADPVIKEIIGYKLRASFDSALDAQETEDVYNNVVLSLLTRLRAVKLNSENHSINNFRSYVATITYHACSNHLREKYPQRHILKNRLRYFLTHEAGFALWEGQDRQWLCGFTRWQASSQSAVGSYQRQALRDHPNGILSASLLVEDLHRTKLKELLTAIFEHLKGPIEIDELVKLVAEVCGIQDRATSAERNEETSGNLSELLPDTRTDVELELEQRSYLKKLWSEVCELPEKQRAALLLNLKDAQGGSGLALFPLTGTTNFGQLAQALLMSIEELSGLWSELPLDDLRIAARLGLTRQQVINLRKSARERLARRLKDY
jgi:DNA-directed RNA polymerase specialized sigma24 family protein